MMKLDTRRVVGLAAVMTVLGWGATSSGAAPNFQSLPVVSFTDLPKQEHLPKRISPLSKMPGLVPTTAKPHGRRGGSVQGYKVVGLLVNDDDAEQFRNNKLDRWGRRPEDGRVVGAVTTCFAVADHWRLERKTDRTWPTRLEQWPQMRSAASGSQGAKESPEYQKARALRIERLVPGEDSATLHLQEGWFDPVTLGAQQTAAYQLEFKHVARGPGDVDVYAARSRDGESVEFLVSRPLLDDKRMAAVGRHMTSRRRNGGGSSNCGHVRVSLLTAPGTGDSGSVQLDVVLPDAEENGARKKNGAGNKKRRPVDSKQAPKDEPARPILIRIRTLLVHVGTSQGLTEKAPTTTVSFGWRGRERRQQIF